ncbi:MAG: RNA polymerase sigma factor [Niabella sp.]
MVSSNTELESLIKGCINDTMQDKEALYKAFYGYIKGVILRYVRDQHRAEELVNDSFIKIFTHIGSFKGTENTIDLQLSFKSWVAKIASRTAIDFLRRKNVNFQMDEINEYNSPKALQSNPEDQSSSKEILDLLDQLPQTQKTIFNLYEIEGFSHEEIAGLLAIPVNVCRVYLSRAKAKLKSLYIKHFN